MALRLVLVGMVAGLGLTLPTGQQVSDWKGHAQGWVASRLARWDARVPSGPDAFVLVNDPAPPTRPQSPSTVQPAPADGPSIPSRIDGPTLLAEDAGFQDAVDAWLRELAAAPSEPSIMVEKLTARQSYEPLEAPEDLYEGVAYAMNRASEGLGVYPRISRVPGADDRLYEPLVVGDDLYGGIAYELNRLSDGMSEVASPVISTEDGRLTRAVRLTREAVFAWANLIQGPAVVTVGR